MTDDTTMTPEEAAAYLKLNLRTVYRNLRSGRLPGTKVGRQWRIRRNDLCSLLTGAARTGEMRAAYQADTRPVERPQSSTTRRAMLRYELDRAIRIVAGMLHPSLILVYGSFARGEESAWSDLDLAVVAETEPAFLRA